MEALKEILAYAKSQKNYCNVQAEKDKYKTDTYSKRNYTDEQMSGYYQGRAEANQMIIYQIEDKEKKGNWFQKLELWQQLLLHLVSGLVLGIVIMW